MASVADVDVEECIKASVTSCIIGQAYYGEAKLEWNKDTLTVALKLNSDQIFHATGDDLIEVKINEKGDKMEVSARKGNSVKKITVMGGGPALSSLAAFLLSRLDRNSSPDKENSIPTTTSSTSVFNRPPDIIPSGQVRTSPGPQTKQGFPPHWVPSTAAETHVSHTATRHLQHLNGSKPSQKPETIPLMERIEAEMMHNMKKQDKAEEDAEAAAQAQRASLPFPKTHGLVPQRVASILDPFAKKPPSSSTHTQIPITAYTVADTGNQNKRPQSNGASSASKNGSFSSTPTLSTFTASSFQSAGLAYKKAYSNRGIVNTGNSCYINATLQALLSMTSFVADLRAPKLRDLVAELDLRSLFKAVLTISDEVKHAQTRTGPLDPLRVKYAIARHCPDFRNNAQQDAHEFLVAFLTNLEAELMPDLNKAREQQQLEALARADSPRNPGKNNDSTTGSGRRSRSAVKKEESSSRSSTSNASSADGSQSTDKPSPFIQDGIPFSQRMTLLCPSKRNFAGTLQLDVNCQACKKSSTAYESFRHLTLDVFESVQSLIDHCVSNLFGSSNDTADAEEEMRATLKSRLGSKNAPFETPTIEQLLFAYFSSEVIEKRCESCRHSTALLRRKLIQLPRVLVIHLKRFSFNMATQEHSKLKYKTRLSADVNVKCFCASNLNCAGPIPYEPLPVDDTDLQTLTMQLNDDEQMLQAMLRSERESLAPSPPPTKTYTTTSISDFTTAVKKPHPPSNLGRPSTSMNLQTTSVRMNQDSTSISLSGGALRGPGGILNERSAAFQDKISSALDTIPAPAKRSASEFTTSSQDDDWLYEPTHPIKKAKLEESDSVPVHTISDPPSVEMAVDDQPDLFSSLHLPHQPASPDLPDSPRSEEMSELAPYMNLPSAMHAEFDPSQFSSMSPRTVHPLAHGSYLKSDDEVQSYQAGARGKSGQERRTGQSSGLKGGMPPKRQPDPFEFPSDTDADHDDAFDFSSMRSTYTIGADGVTPPVVAKVQEQEAYLASLKKRAKQDDADAEYAPQHDAGDAADETDDDEAHYYDAEDYDDTKMKYHERMMWHLAKSYFNTPAKGKSPKFDDVTTPLPVLKHPSWSMSSESSSSTSYKPAVSSYSYSKSAPPAPTLQKPHSMPISLDEDDKDDLNLDDHDEDLKKALAESKKMDDERAKKNAKLAEIEKSLTERRAAYSVYGGFDTDASKQKKDETNPWEADLIAPGPPEAGGKKLKKQDPDHSAATASYDPPRPPRSYEYTLKAIVNHIGERTTSGHYIADVCEQFDEKSHWITYDDETAKDISVEQVLRRDFTPYILFYVNKLVLRA